MKENITDKKIKITFHGGTGTVTGSNFLLEGVGKRILIDVGLQQGCYKVCDDNNRKPFPYDPASIDLVLITHSHIDHVGRLPKLVRDGFKGVVYSTHPTKELAEAMMLDSMGVLAKEAKKDNLPIIYDENDVANAMKLWKSFPYHEKIDLGGGLSLKFLNSGHVLGSSMVELMFNNKKVVFTGDLGNSPSPLLKDCEKLENVDYLIMETVYGDRNHEDRGERKKILEEVIQETIKDKGVLMMPAFSLERTQEILYEINDLVENRKIPPVSIYLDSPLAIKVTAIYMKSKEYFNETARKIIEGGDDLFNFQGLKKTLTTEESRDILKSQNPKVIIAGSGMSNGGRIIHHEKHYLPSKNNTLLLVGYQAAGTLGRILQEGARSVNIMGEEVPVNAKITTISGYSAHKDSDALLEFVDNTRDSLKKVFAVMGEPKSAMFFVQKLRDNLAIDASAPQVGDVIEIDLS